MSYQPGDVVLVRAVLVREVVWDDPPGCRWWQAHVPDAGGSLVDVAMVSPSEDIDQSAEIQPWPVPCCHLHQNVGCCDPNDCGPCCENCPTCPELRRRRLAEATS